MSYFKLNVNPYKRVGMDGVFLGLARLLLGISLRRCPRKISQSSPASPRKTLSIPTILLGLTHYREHPILALRNTLQNMASMECTVKYCPPREGNTENQLFQYYPTLEDNI